MDFQARYPTRQPPTPLNTRACAPSDPPPSRASTSYSVRSVRSEARSSTDVRPRSRRPSFKRAASVLSEPGVPDPPSSPRSSSNYPRKSWAHPRRSLAKPTLRTLEEPQPPPQYYQDPETRSRLKEYLGSPQKFEEALEHGFPSPLPGTPGKETQFPHSQLTPRLSVVRARASNNDAPKFLRSDIISWLDNEDDDEDDDEQVLAVPAAAPATGAKADLGEFDIDDYLDDPADRSSAEIHSPITPRAPDFAPVARPKSARCTPHPLPSASIPPSPRQRPRPASERPMSDYQYDHPSAYSTPASPASPAWPGARDMTLRMTLTRPELRAPEEKIYGRVRGHSDVPRRLIRATNDPWDLPPLGETAEPHEDRKPAQHGRRKSLWRKMSLVGMRK